jgi:hypothetical protein
VGKEQSGSERRVSVEEGQVDLFNLQLQYPGFLAAMKEFEEKFRGSEAGLRTSFVHGLSMCLYYYYYTTSSSQCIY